jgi:hypothetical protein
MKLFLMNAAFVRFQAISDRGAIGGDCFFASRLADRAPWGEKWA